jgi:hypothetical protein
MTIPMFGEICGLWIEDGRVDFENVALAEVDGEVGEDTGFEKSVGLLVGAC